VIVSKPADELPEIRLDEVIGESAHKRPTTKSLISEDTARELQRAAEQLANDPTMPSFNVTLESDAPPVIPGVMDDEPSAVGLPPMTSAPESMDLDQLLEDLENEQRAEAALGALGAADADLRSQLAGTEPEDIAQALPQIVAPADDPLAPQLPLSLEEPPPVTRIALEQLMPDPTALEKLRKLAGAAGNPERTRKTLTAALSHGAYDPRYLPEPRVMLVGIARVLVAHGLPADEMVEAIMASLTD
jgi:hypothetical protein